MSEFGILDEVVPLVCGKTAVVMTFVLGAVVVRCITNLIIDLLARSHMKITKNSVICLCLSGAANFIPAFCWELVTWTIFGLGYVLKAGYTNVIGMGLCFLYFPGYSLSPGAIALMVPWSVYILFKARALCQQEFRDFVALGPGGTPSTFAGHKRLSLLGWFARTRVLVPPRHHLGNGLLPSLPERIGERPTVGGIAPQRQTNHRNSKEIFSQLLSRFNDYAIANTDHLRTGMSFLEKITEAIFSRCDCVTDSVFRTFGCEITHLHHADGSLHVVLHPEDLRTLIEKGWGERHPLSRADPAWLVWMFSFEARPPVPEHLAFVYAPRTVEEVDTVMRIIDAGARFVADENKGATKGTCPAGTTAFAVAGR